MFGKRYVRELINRSAENTADRLRFVRAASAAGLGLVGAGLLRSVRSRRYRRPRVKQTRFPTARSSTSR